MSRVRVFLEEGKANGKIDPKVFLIMLRNLLYQTLLLKKRLRCCVYIIFIGLDFYSLLKPGLST